MIEFERWFNNIVLAIGDQDTLPRHKSKYAAGWIGALQWVSKNWIYSHTLPEDEDFVKIIKVSIIKKELENK